MKIQSTTTRTSIRIAINALIAAGALALVSGCHRHDDDHDHAKSSEAKGGGHKHEHTPRTAARLSSSAMRRFTSNSSATPMPASCRFTSWTANWRNSSASPRRRST